MMLIGTTLHLRDGSTGRVISIRQNRPWFVEVTNEAEGTRLVSVIGSVIEGEAFANWLRRHGINQDRDGWSMLCLACSQAQAAPLPTPSTTNARIRPRYGAGVVRWCGGRNNVTGRDRKFGFIEAEGGDLYFHRSGVVSPWDELRPDMRVVYRLGKGVDSRTAATEVRILEGLSDQALLACMQAADDLGKLHPDQGLLALFAATDDGALRAEVLVRLVKIGSGETLTRLAEHMAATLPADVTQGLLDSLAPQTLLRPEALALRSMLPGLKHLKLLIELDSLAEYQAESLRLVAAVAAVPGMERVLERFWCRFPPSSPKDPFFPFAPVQLKTLICKRHYAEFRERLSGVFSSVDGVKTSLDADEVYKELNERDQAIASIWAGDGYEGVLAKMLSARAAEKAAMTFYEGIGAHVEDISIKQLEGTSKAWTTHDLLVDAAVAVDVKNARRPVSGASFYVEHTVPRFKLARREAHVRVAGVLSPYLNIQYIKAPDTISAAANVVFLGETGLESLHQLTAMFGSNTFELTRPKERRFPHWVFSYPPAWYRVFRTDIERLSRETEWPAEEEWDYVFDTAEKLHAIPALCVAGKPLPLAISSRLRGWQIDFYAKMQSLAGASPELPVIFLAVLTDFLEKIKGGHEDFSPDGYRPLLFADRPGTSAAGPLGAIDPLGLVRSLVETLGTLWDSRAKTKLASFSSFRFGGLGLLQGRAKGETAWTTLMAYCGGTEYQKDDAGHIIFNSDDRPAQEKGRCGQAPLVIGQHASCAVCEKLVCNKCGFCSTQCQKTVFQELAEAQRQKKDEGRRLGIPGFERMDAFAAGWEGIPLSVYEDDFRRSR